MEVQYSGGAENNNQQDAGEVLTKFISRLQDIYNILGSNSYNRSTTGMRYGALIPNIAQTRNTDIITRFMGMYGKTLFDPLVYIFGCISYEDKWCEYDTYIATNVILGTSLPIRSITNIQNQNFQDIINSLSQQKNVHLIKCVTGAPPATLQWEGMGLGRTPTGPGYEQNYYIPVAPYLIISLVLLRTEMVGGRRRQIKYSDFSLEKATFLNNVMIQGYNKSNVEYEICSFVIHSGSAGGGHYFSLVKKSNGWWLCDDSNAAKISESTPTTTERDRIWNLCYGGNNVTTHIFLKYTRNDFFLKTIDTVNNGFFSGVLSETPFNPKGLRNLGNTCFFNAMLQCLIHNPYLYHLFTNLCPPNYPPGGGPPPRGPSPGGVPGGPPPGGPSTITAGPKPNPFLKILSWNMMYDCHTATGTKECYNNMIHYINTTNPYIFCAQEASWFFPARPQSHTSGYEGKVINNITLKGYKDVDSSGNTKNIAWAGGTDICIIYWNPDYFAVDPNFPLTKADGTVPDPLRIRKGNIPKSSSGKWATKNAHPNSQSRPVIGVRLIPRWDLSKKWIIISMHAMHGMTVTNLKSFVNPILDALDYITADKIVLAGDFNELYDEGLAKLKSIQFGSSTKITLNLPNSIGLNDTEWNKWKTCCKTRSGDHSAAFDLFYSNFPKADSTAEEKTNKNLSDHTPILTYIYNGPDY